MKLNVLSAGAREEAWYAEGLQFTCTQCGNCCTGGPGYVWLSSQEIERLAAHLELTPRETIEQYCRKIDGRFSLNERRNARGEYDCVFLREEKVQSRTGGGVTHVKRGCAIYAVRPLQCRTWPFWDGNLATQANWNRSAERCHGMNHGRRFTKPEIEALQNAKDWPKKPPTSGGDV